MRKSRPIPALIPERRLRARVRALGRRIRKDHPQRPLLFVGVLRGAFVFLADLIREVGPPLECDFVGVSSYGDRMESRGRPRLELDLCRPVRGRSVVLVEDIIDSGRTASFLLDLLRRRRPASLRLCALLRKPSRVKFPLQVDYLGFDIPDGFVVGYGMDYAGRYRHLPYVGLWRGGGR